MGTWRPALTSLNLPHNWIVIFSLLPLALNVRFIGLQKNMHVYVDVSTSPDDYEDLLCKRRLSALQPLQGLRGACIPASATGDHSLPPHRYLVSQQLFLLQNRKSCSSLASTHTHTHTLGPLLKITVTMVVLLATKSWSKFFASTAHCCSHSMHY